MAKNIILLLTLIAIVGGGIGYAFYSDPDQASIQLFDQTMIEFAKNAQNLESQYEKNGFLIESEKILHPDFTGLQESNDRLMVNMIVAKQQVSLVFSDGEWPLANQSIILEPFLPENISQEDSAPTVSSGNKQVRWKCLSGSVLVRFRSKNCRLGYGVLSAELR